VSLMIEIGRPMAETSCLVQLLYFSIIRATPH